MKTSVTTLPGVTARVGGQLARLGIYTVEDLLFHLPSRYEDRTQLVALKDLQEGETVLIEGTIQYVEIKKGKRRSLICLLSDGTGQVSLRFFHFYPAQQQQLQPGIKLRCFGEVRYGYTGLELVHPEYQRVEGTLPLNIDEHLTPIYPSTEGLHQNQLRTLIHHLLETQEIVEYLPATLLAYFNLPALPEALRFIHHPPRGSDLEQLQARQHPTQQRIAFEELLAHQLSLYALRQRAHAHHAPSLEHRGHLTQKLLAQLPFKLTKAQQRVYSEISADLCTTRPMQRLVQGDVGSGKTIVAALSALQAIESGYQVAVMAPTELLSEQHLHTFTQWLEPLEIRVVWLTGSLSKKKRQQVLEHIALGSAHLAVGTHALFQKEVEFAQLGLVIIDEQHRFGVHQRLALRNKGNHQGACPHQLIMTATPIPRTLAMTAYADLDTSVIDELPPGRTPVNTVIISNHRREEIMERIRHACRQSRQAYWVCTLIEESEALQFQAAENTALQLRQALPELRIGLLHGRMKSKEKEAVMAEFKAGQLDLLVATTVIEVGMDVPNASLMIIENAERLGLAQLHQLRGRIGRGSLQSHCVLLYQFPLSEIAQSRLAILREVHDGFVIAQRDLEIRGPGEVLGTRQTGVMNLRVADLQKDQDLLPLVTQAGRMIFEQHHSVFLPIIQRWLREEGLHYGEV